LKEIRPAALALKLKLEEITTQPEPKDLERAFQIAKQKQVGAIMTTSNRPFFGERKQIVELAGKNQLPAIYFDIVARAAPVEPSLRLDCLHTLADKPYRIGVNSEIVVP
jgi:hypothetical protein